MVNSAKYLGPLFHRMEGNGTEQIETLFHGMEWNKTLSSIIEIFSPYFMPRAFIGFVI